MLSLRSKIVQSVLGYFMLHEEAELYVNEMARRFSLDDGNLARKLKELEQEGILKSRLRGKERYYSLNESFPLLKEYKKIILKTVGFEEILNNALKHLKGIEKAYLFGSYAEDKMDVSSDIDLVVVGKHMVCLKLVWHGTLFCKVARTNYLLSPCSSQLGSLLFTLKCVWARIPSNFFCLFGQSTQTSKIIFVG